MVKKRSSDEAFKNEYKIKVSSNGPYLIFGGIPLTDQVIGTDTEGYAYEWQPGKKYPVEGEYALCRCGKSNKKPFCDGTHTQVDFDGTETASQQPYLEQAKKIDGPELDLTDARELCATARFCTRAKGIWDLIKRPETPEAKDIAVAEAENCPSGRLVVWDKNGERIEPEFEPSIGLVEDPQKEVQGPIWVRGGIPIESADGITCEIRNSVTLCRCGISSNKPLCDGSHCNVESE